jgi:uncharacterized protein YcbX
MVGTVGRESARNHKEQQVKVVGSVVAVWRYPVKSMQGEELNGAAITERGVLGDRAYAIRDQANGHIASAKHPRKWSALFACRAAFVEPPQPGCPLPPIWITLPDGTVISSAQPDVDGVLSRALGRDVTLVAEAPAAPTREADRSPIDGEAETLIREEPMALASPAGTFFDYAPLHIVTTATLDRLQELYPAGRFEARRFRPNIVVAPTDHKSGFVENQWLGHAVTIGTELRLQAIDPSPRCVVTTLAQADLPHDPGILRTLAQHNAVASATLAPGVVFPAVAGVYLQVVQPGSISRGDPVGLS